MTQTINAQPTTRSLRRTVFVATTIVGAALIGAGCANMDDTQKRTAGGAAAGAVLGGVLSKATGNSGTIGAVVGGAAGAVIGNVWSKRLESQKQAMEQATQGTGVEVTRTADNQLKLNIPNDISFATNSAALKPELRSVLETFATSLRQNPTLVVKAIGHTDSTGSDAINNPLSVSRANSVRDFLTDRGVASNRIEADGRGSREPIASNNDEASRAKNRRVEIFVRDTAAAS